MNTASINYGSRAVLGMNDGSASAEAIVVLRASDGRAAPGT